MRNLGASNRCFDCRPLTEGYQFVWTSMYFMIKTLNKIMYFSEFIVFLAYVKKFPLDFLVSLALLLPFTRRTVIKLCYFCLKQPRIVGSQFTVPFEIVDVVLVATLKFEYITFRIRILTTETNNCYFSAISLRFWALVTSNYFFP